MNDDDDDGNAEEHQTGNSIPQTMHRTMPG